MKMHQPKHYIALLVLLALWTGCASSPHTSSPTSNPQPRAPVTLKEEFDPRSIQEDLLLIQPAFPRPTSADATNEVAATAAPAPVEEARLPELELEPEPDLELEPELASVAETHFETATTYRIQVMALSDADLARKRGDELEKILGVPVFVEPQDQLFVVRVGNFRERQEAAAIREKLALLQVEYQDAYVVALEETHETSLPVPHSAEAPAAAPPATIAPEIPPPVLVPAFGWRVLLDQFLNHSDAEKLKRKAMRNLKRQDIDVIFKAPWYKVELGNFRTEAKAQEWVEKIKAKKYNNALKVRAQIFVPQE